MELDPETNDSPPSNAWLGEGIAIANQIIVVCFGLVVPILVGYWADSNWNSEPILMVLGLILGMLVAGLQLRQMLSWLNQRSLKRKTAKKVETAIQNPQTHQTSAAHPPNALDTTIAPKHRELQNLNKEVDPWEQRWNDKWTDSKAENDDQN